MHRIDHATAAPGELFTEGNPATATPATTVTDDWLNDIQENLAQLVEAASLALVKGDGTQVTDAIQALIAAAFAGVTTPPQFDNDASLATTEFVRRQGMQYSGVLLITSATVLTAADAGKLIWIAGAGGYNITLPSLAAFPSGVAFDFYSSSGAACSVVRAGADTIFVDGSTVTFVSVGIGDTLRITGHAGAAWAANGGSAQLGRSAAFGSFIAASGYQKLPSGLIIQWGSTGNITAGNNLAVTYPIAFPTGMLGCSVSPSYSTTGAAAAYMSHANTSASTLTINNTGAITCGARWIAIGY